MAGLCGLLRLNGACVYCRYNDVGTEQSMKQEVKDGHRRYICTLSARVRHSLSAHTCTRTGSRVYVRWYAGYTGRPLIMIITSCAGGRHNMPCDLDLWPFNLENGVRVGYLCAKFSLPGLLCSRLRPDVRVRQTSDRRQTASSLNAPA